MDLRITARITARIMAMTMEMTVSSNVYLMPSRTFSSNRYFQTTFHSKRGLVIRPCSSMAAIRATMTAATIGPVRLTGSALMRFGISRPSPSICFFAMMLQFLRC